MIELTIDQTQIDKINSTLDKIGIRDRYGLMRKYFGNVTKETELTLKKQILSGQVLKVRTGRLRTSVGSLVAEKNDTLYGLVGSGVRTGRRVPYANIHETGGVITARNAKYLTIPLKAAKTRSGSQLKGGALGARDFSNTFVMRGRSGNLLIMQRKSKDKIIPLFVLKRSVNIPARRYMTRATELMTPKLDQLFDISFKQVFGRELNQ